MQLGEVGSPETHSWDAPRHRAHRAIGRAPNAGGGGGGASLLPLRPSACLRAFKLIDAEYLKPIFGGRIWDDVDVEDEDD